MCTATVLKIDDQEQKIIRTAINRDELRKRPISLGIKNRTCGKREALMPIDPVSNGTWIGVNDAGIVAMVINIFDQPYATYQPKGELSRGAIIPAILSADTIEQAIKFLTVLGPKKFAPCHVIFHDSTRIAKTKIVEGRWSSPQISSLAKHLLVTSSGLGDAMVYGPRSELFANFVQGAFSDKGQDSFHKHSWPDKPEISICMREAEAATVSYTVIELSASEAQMSYFNGPPDETETKQHLLLKLK